MRRSKGQGHKQPIHITWRSEPPSPAQLVAWRQLWAWLLEEGHSHKNVDAPGDAIPEASQNDGTGFADLAAATASTSPTTRRYR